MNKKTSQPIDLTLPAFEVDMGGISVLQPLPTANVQQIDPFLLLHHHASVLPAGHRVSDLGIGPHPHRGFSPVTFVFKGEVHHRDSRQNSSIVKAGGVQWMNAGMGIIHSERPSKAFAENGGEQEIIQLWINTPAAKKMDQPKYFALQKEDMPKVEGVTGDVRVVAGNFANQQGPAKTDSPIIALMGEMAAQDEIQFEKADGDHAILYVLSGSGFLSGFGLVEEKTLYSFSSHEVFSTLKATADLRFIFLSAQPINEKVEHYGPFVMNNQTQIMEAMRDYQMGKMGFLVEEF
jgi:redox-sensitive bicupin YhaK (pirin superfamily)